jgi:hypothetical protein
MKNTFREGFDEFLHLSELYSLNKPQFIETKTLLSQVAEKSKVRILSYISSVYVLHVWR